ncbi:MAG: methyltransferase regulatory domain-containing protein [Acidimicrobiales bacterium]
MPTPYDEVRYPTFSHSQLHPDRLAVPAWLFGLDPAPAEACRFLELGCGDAGTLSALAVALPDSQFVGVDLAATAVQRGRDVCEQVGIGNLTLVEADVADLPDLGTFDYVVCHGVFSWVPEPARQGILRACRERLRPDGVAYLSYNANPSGLLREMTRQMLRFHLRRGTRTPEDKLQEALSFLGFLVSARNEGDPWRNLLESEIEHLERRLPSSLVHDELAEVNTPFWLYEVLEMAADHGLRFVAEADDLGVQDILWPDHVVNLLRTLEDEPEAREQYLDFLVARRFRQTLLCHDDRLLDRPCPPSRVQVLDVAAAVAVVGSDDPDLAPGVHVEFATANGLTAGTDMALGKAALHLLGQRWPAAVPFRDLLAAARQATAAWRGRGQPDDGEDLARFLVRVQGARVVELRRHRPAWPCRLEEVADRPRSSPLARHQAGLGGGVATLRGETIALDPVVRLVLDLCDGHRDRAELTAKLAELAEQPDGSPPGREALERSLGQLAELGLLLR